MIRGSDLFLSIFIQNIDLLPAPTKLFSAFYNILFFIPLFVVDDPDKLFVFYCNIPT